MPDPQSTAEAHEFTGERVIAGQVDVNLWNEHKARYAFAARLSRNRRVLDIGCGSGYGSFDLAQCAVQVTGVDNALHALAYAHEHYRARNVRWTNGSAAALPFRDACFDLVVAFEVIEHLSDWRTMLEEARRMLAPGGQFIVSTPNKLYYAESRKASGPNPFHEHEFEYAEFTAALLDVFPHVSLFLEDHTEGILFRPTSGSRGADVRLDRDEVRPEEANFFLAVCALSPQTGAPTFVYLPEGGNVLRERELHIRRLEDELRTKDAWLEKSQREHADLVEQFRAQTAELRERNVWAQKVSDELASASDRVAALQIELASEQAAALATVDAYNAKVLELEEENRVKTLWAQDTETRMAAELESKCDELTQAVQLLQAAENTVEERTKWALQLQATSELLQAQLNLVQASRWIRLGRRLGVGPRLTEQ